MRSTILLLSGGVCLVSSSPLLTNRASNNTSTAQTWDEITPSSDLKWTSCFDAYTCARLIVPLDYANTSAGTATIAYIKQSATIDPENAEDILINPGGPGESGVKELLSLGSQLQQILGLQYNIIGFDPRGVNNSTPALTCFADNPEAEKIYQTQFLRSVDGKSEYSLRHEFEAATAFGKWCTEANENSDAKYANTVSTAQDMLNYIEKANECKGKDAKDAKINYYGISYGTVLGATFASLFPDRIARMALDGVVNSEDYFAGIWPTSLHSVDDAIADFFHFCYKAGPDACALWADSPEEIESRTRDVLEAVRESPVPFWDPNVVAYPQLITYEHLDYMLLTSMYAPLTVWPILAQVLVEMESRNGTTLAGVLQEIPPTLVGNTVMIACIDAMGKGNLTTYEKWEAYLQEVTEQSEWVADAWAALPLACKDMNILPPKSQQFTGFAPTTETSHPIFLLSNTHDPSTPLIHAQHMVTLFSGSEILVQNAPGHVTTLAAVSECTYGYLNKYFGTGELPPADTVCEVESVPFVTGITE